DDVHRHAVLHRPRGIQVLALDVDLRGDVARDLLQLDDGGMPHRLEDVRHRAFHHWSSSKRNASGFFSRMRSIAASSMRSFIVFPPYLDTMRSSYSSATRATSRTVARSSSGSSVAPPRMEWMNSTSCPSGSYANAPKRMCALSSSSLSARPPSICTPRTSWATQRTSA